MHGGWQILAGASREQSFACRRYRHAYEDTTRNAVTATASLVAQNKTPHNSAAGALPMKQCLAVQRDMHSEPPPTRGTPGLDIHTQSDGIAAKLCAEN
jgi:hypothetical protein